MVLSKLGLPQVLVSKFTEEVPCQPVPTVLLLKLLLIAADTIDPVAVNVADKPLQIGLGVAVKLILHPGVPSGV